MRRDWVDHVLDSAEHGVGGQLEAPPADGFHPPTVHGCLGDVVGEGFVYLRSVVRNDTTSKRVSQDVPQRKFRRSSQLDKEVSK